MATSMQTCLAEVIQAAHDEMKLWIRKELQEQLSVHNSGCNCLSHKKVSETACTAFLPVIVESAAFGDPCAGGASTSKTTRFSSIYSREGEFDAKPIKRMGAASLHHASDGILWPTKGWQYKLRKLLSSYRWRVGFLIVLVMNSVLIGVDIRALCTHRSHSKLALYLDAFVCFLCTLELGLRILSQGVGFFQTRGVAANVFESICVILHQFDVIRALLNDGCIMYWSSVRVFRTITFAVRGKVGRYVSSLRTLTTSVLSTFRWIFFTFLILLVIMYVTALYITNAVHLQGKSDIADSEAYYDADLETLYGTVPTTMVSLFQCITGGVDWATALAPLKSRIGNFMTVPFLAYIAFTMMGLMNVIAAVFVESALKNTKKDQELILIKNTRQLFEDEDGGYTQTLSYDMLMTELEKPAMKEYFRAIDVDPSEAPNVWSLIDANKSGTITADDFLNRSLALSGTARALDIAIIRQDTIFLARCMEKVLNLLEPKTQQMDQRGAAPDGTSHLAKHTNTPGVVCHESSGSLKKFGAKSRREVGTKGRPNVISKQLVEDKE